MISTNFVQIINPCECGNHLEFTYSQHTQTNGYNDCFKHCLRCQKKTLEYSYKMTVWPDTSSKNTIYSSTQIRQ